MKGKSMVKNASPLSINGSILTVPFNSIERAVQVQTCDENPEKLFIFYRKAGELPYVVGIGQGQKFYDDYAEWQKSQLISGS